MAMEIKIKNPPCFIGNSSANDGLSISMFNRRSVSMSLLSMSRNNQDVQRTKPLQGFLHVFDECSSIVGGPMNWMPELLQSEERPPSWTQHKRWTISAEQSALKFGQRLQRVHAGFLSFKIFDFLTAPSFCRSSNFLLTPLLPTWTPGSLLERSGSN